MPNPGFGIGHLLALNAARNFDELEGSVIVIQNVLSHSHLDSASTLRGKNCSQFSLPMFAILSKKNGTSKRCCDVPTVTLVLREAVQRGRVADGAGTQPPPASRS